MMVRRTEVKTFKEEVICSRCGGGVMESVNNISTSNPPKYVHKCNRCGYTDTFES